MIFVTVGTQKFNFDRLLKKIEQLKKNNIIQEEIIAQVGLSKFNTEAFTTIKFIEPTEFNQIVANANLIISHGGTGTITNVLAMNKPLIVVPRLKKYHEHVDDHQMDIINLFSNRGYVIPCYEIDDLEKLIINFKSYRLKPYVRTPNSKIIKILEDFVAKTIIKN